MIKVYNEKEFNNSFIEDLLKEDELWDFSMDELDYLLENHGNESFVLIDNRLWELSVDYEKYLNKEER